MDRSYLVLAAAALLAVLAVVQLLRDDEPAPGPAPAPTASARGDAAPLPAASAAPGEAPESGPLVLRSALVQGQVTSARGGRVPGARIAVRGGRAEQGVTDASGAYELRLELQEGEVPTLRFSADGYEDEVLELERVALAGGQVRLDVRLDPAPGAIVSGTLTTERGSPIAGETIHLDWVSSNARHAALTDAGGQFFIPGVQPGAGYYLFVRPQSGYGDYQRAVEVGPDGLSLDIALRELSTARLSGRLMDTQGRPIPNLGFSVVSGQSLGKSLRTTSDAEGRFVIDDVPTGYLSFLASTPEKLEISGVRLSPGSDEEVVLRADWGDEALRGRVVDEAGRPLAGAEVELSWSHVSEGSAGRSNRSTVTDAGGSFEFRRLGGGIHRLDVRAPGHRDVQLDYEVTPQSPGVEVQLEPAREAG